ncbi:MAG: hypothetical protein OXI90_07765 [Gammaproteobacteria bacterium]|nr:hypothetical protein [Gammaproteobacteria bacterium]
MVTWAHFASLWLAGALPATPLANAPAIITNSTPSVRADISQAVTRALGRKPLIADDALTTSSLLIIERREPRTIDGRVGSGRILDPPETFQLVLDGDQCVLLHRRTEAAYPLENARCRPAPTTPESAPSPDQEQQSPCFDAPQSHNGRHV